MKSLSALALFLTVLFFNVLSAHHAWAVLKPCPVEAPSIQLPELKKIKGEPIELTEAIQALAKNGAQLICETQFAKRKSCPHTMIESLLQIISLTQDSLEPESPVGFDQIIEGPKGPHQINYPTQVVRGPDNAIYLHIGHDIIEAGTGSFKAAVLVFRLTQDHWTPAIFLTFKDPSSVKQEPGRSRWNRELEVSRLILQQRRVNPLLSQGLPFIYWVSENGVYQKRYDGSLFELFSSPTWTSFRHAEKMEAIRQAALALKNFHLLEEGSIVHEDIKMDNFLFSLKFPGTEDQCSDIVLSDLDLSHNSARLIQAGRLRPNNGTFFFFDPSTIYRADGFAAWKPFEYDAKPPINATREGAEWLGNTDQEKVQNAQRGDLYGLGLTSAIGIFGMQNNFWATTLGPNNNPPSKTHSPLTRARDIQKWIDKYLKETSYCPVHELLRMALEADPRKRITSSQYYQALEYALSPIEAMGEPIVPMQKLLPCSEIKLLAHKMKVGEFSICHSLTGPTFEILYKVPSQAEVFRVSEKKFSEEMTWPEIQHEIEFLKLLGVIHTEFHPETTADTLKNAN